MDDPIDFLADRADDESATLLAAVEAVRGELLDWAAVAWAARHPDPSAPRGPKGTVQRRIDLDRHLKAAIGRDGPASPAAISDHRAWMVATVCGPRRQDPASIGLAGGVLAEAVVRFVAHPSAPGLAVAIASGLGCPDPEVRRLVAQRVATS